LESLLLIFQIPNSKSQTTNKFQAPISNDLNSYYTFGILVIPASRQAGGFLWDLACLREAASAKAGACHLVLID
jgi:hypothetical protein